MVAAGAAFGTVPAENTAALRAGTAIVDVTPPMGISIVGNFTDAKAARVHDPLHVRCLALDDGHTRLALVTVDNCLVSRELFDAAKRRIHKRDGLPPSCVLVSAVHTHSGPAVTGVFQSDPDPNYAKFLAERIADVVHEAVERLEPARIAWGRGTLPSEVHNRRWYMRPEGIVPDPFGQRNDRVRMNPPRASAAMIEAAGPVDPEVCFIALQRPDGSPLGLYANYSLHYVGGAPEGDISADYFAVFAREIARSLGAPPDSSAFLALLSNGTSGDVNNIRHDAQEPAQPPYAQMQKVGRLLAEEVHRAFAGLQWHDAAQLDAVTREIKADVRKPSKEELRQAQATLAAAPAGGLKRASDIYARETVLLDQYPDRVKLVLQVLRIGDVTIAAVPCEVFAETGLAIKAQHSLPMAFTVSLANGYNGYLPPAKQHALGGYETWRARSSYLEIAAEAKIRKNIMELLRKLN